MHMPVAAESEMTGIYTDFAFARGFVAQPTTYESHSVELDNEPDDDADKLLKSAGSFSRTRSMGGF